MNRNVARISGAMLRSALVLGAVLSLVVTMSGSAMTAVVPKSGKALGYASIDGFTGTIRAFGGYGTKAASVTVVGLGGYEITFTGHFPPQVTANTTIVIATAESKIFAVANAEVISASPKSITVVVATFDPFGEFMEDNNCFVVVFFG
jgi:hypothetical protein